MIIDKEHSDIQVYPFIAFIDGKAAQVAGQFVQLTGFQADELIGKTMQEVTSLLRLNRELSDIIFEDELFLFTKSLEPRNVQVIMGESSTDGLVYYFNERPNSRLEEKFPVIGQAQNDNIVGVAIFKLPEITLLKANRTWLSFLDKPYDEPSNSLGKPISDVITGWKGSTSEQFWRDFLEGGKAFRNREYRYENFDRGVTYWDASLTPVKEGGIIKYAVEITTDITESVLQKKKLEEQAAIILNQNEHMNAVLNNMTDALFVVDKQKNIILHNKAAKEFFYDHNVESYLGESMKHTKYCDMNGKELTVDEFPATKILQGETIKSFRIVVKRPDGKTLHYNLSGSPIHDEQGNVVEALLCCSDITELIQYQEAAIEAEQ